MDRHHRLPPPRRSELVGAGADPIGSSGYGREHATRLRSRWGELDLPQQLSAIDQLRARGVADERVAIAGKSYGGYLAAFAIGKIDRFRAAIVSAPITSFESHSGTSDSGYYVDVYDLEGELWERRELARTRRRREDGALGPRRARGGPIEAS